MDTFSIILIIIAVAGLVTGWLKGLIGQIGSIAAIVTGIIVCRGFGDRFTALIAPMMGCTPGDASLASILTSLFGNILLFIIVYILVVIFARLLKGLVHGILLGPVDSLAGAIFGAFKWLLLAGVVLDAIVFFDPDGTIAVATDTPVAYVRDLAPWLLGVTGLK